MTNTNQDGQMPNTQPLTLSVILATWFGVGFIPFAPGTMGSIAAVLCAIPISMTSGPAGLAIASLLASLVGIPISSNAAKTMGKKDPGSIVIDEVAGQWIALLPASPNVGAYILAFIVFRCFDITKIGPIGWADRNLEKGTGIMVDDIIAGGFAAVVVYVLQPYIPEFYSFVS